LARIFAIAASHNPDLYECTKLSIISTAMTAAELGLTVGGSLGHLYPVPYGKECVPIIGYKGYVTLAIRSGNIAAIEARNVFENDQFAIDYSKTPQFTHKPQLSNTDRGEYKGSYCVSTTKDGIQQFTWMDCHEVFLIRNRAPSSRKGPWKTDLLEMCRKTVTRRHIKYLDLSGAAADAIAIAEAAEVGVVIKDITPPRQNAEAALRDELGLNEGEAAEYAEVVELEPETDPQGEPHQVELTEQDNVGE
jgi:recombination protein RecT